MTYVKFLTKESNKIVFSDFLAPSPLPESQSVPTTGPSPCPRIARDVAAGREDAGRRNRLPGDPLSGPGAVSGERALWSSGCSAGSARRSRQAAASDRRGRGISEPVAGSMSSSATSSPAGPAAAVSAPNGHDQPLGGTRCRRRHADGREADPGNKRSRSILLPALSISIPTARPSSSRLAATPTEISHVSTHGRSDNLM